MAIATSNAYAITFTTPHSLGDNYLVFAMSRTTGASNAFAVCAGYGKTYAINVWNRTAANSIITGPFSVYSIP